MRKYQVRFGGGLLEKELKDHLASSLPYKNLMETFQEQISKESKAIREVIAPQAASSIDEGPVPLTLRQQRAQEQSRQNRFERWQQAHALFKEGYAKKEIARTMNLDIHTVRTYLMAETFPERQRTSPTNGPLTPFKG